MAFSPDGARLASASDDQTVKLWDAATGQELRTLRGTRRRVWSVAFSPDGTRLASASDDQTVKLWDAVTGQELRTFKGHTAAVRQRGVQPGRAAPGVGQCRPDGEAVGRGHGPGSSAPSRGTRTRSSSVAFSPDGPRLASASDDRTVKLWDAATGQELRTLRGHTGTVYERGVQSRTGRGWPRPVRTGR